MITLMMMRMLLVGMGALLIASCGSDKLPGDNPGLDGARDTATTWYSAIASEDGDTACRLMTTSMRTTVMTLPGTSSCEDGIGRYIATVDERMKQQMKARDFDLTPDGPTHVYTRINDSWRAPTFEESWAQGRWWISGIIE